MKKHSILAVFSLLILVGSNAQCQSLISQISEEKELRSSYSPKSDSDHILIPCEFRSSDLIQTDRLSAVQGRLITRIELVYTKYRESHSFNQMELNRKRLNKFIALDPEILNNPLIHWKLIEVVQPRTESDADHHFHGFVVHLRPEGSPARSEDEIAAIKAFLKDPEFKSDPEIISSELDAASEEEEFEITESEGKLENRLAKYVGGQKKLKEFINDHAQFPPVALNSSKEGTVMVRFIIDKTGKVQNVKAIKRVGYGCDEEAERVIRSMPRWLPGVEKGKLINSVFEIPVEFYLRDRTVGAQPLSYRGAYDKDIDDGLTLIPEVDASVVEYSSSYSYTPIQYEPDTVVSAVFNRNKNWEKLLVVGDLTGSMAPYSGQLLLWYKLNYEKNKETVQHMTFFNDGDFKETRKKRIGETGGIYHSDAMSFESIQALAFKTMRHGSGGDCPENNIEAIIEAIERNPECKEVVLIADNFATPRDMILLENVERPVKVIVCGAYGFVNPAYLEIAWKTKGSIHTIEQDLTDLVDYHEGEVIKIFKKEYRIVKGKFVPLYRS